MVMAVEMSVLLSATAPYVMMLQRVDFELRGVEAPRARGCRVVALVRIMRMEVRRVMVIERLSILGARE